MLVNLNRSIQAAQHSQSQSHSRVPGAHLLGGAMDGYSMNGGLYHPPPWDLLVQGTAQWDRGSGRPSKRPKPQAGVSGHHRWQFGGRQQDRVALKDTGHSSAPIHRAIHATSGLELPKTTVVGRWNLAKRSATRHLAVSSDRAPGPTLKQIDDRRGTWVKIRRRRIREVSEHQTPKVPALLF